VNTTAESIHGTGLGTAGFHLHFSPEGAYHINLVQMAQYLAAVGLSAAVIEIDPVGMRRHWGLFARTFLEIREDDP